RSVSSPTGWASRRTVPRDSSAHADRAGRRAGAGPVRRGGPARLRRTGHAALSRRLVEGAVGSDSPGSSVVRGAGAGRGGSHAAWAGLRAGAGPVSGGGPGRVRRGGRAALSRRLGGGAVGSDAGGSGVVRGAGACRAPGRRHWPRSGSAPIA